jgi:hypothetical protein
LNHLNRYLFYFPEDHYKQLDQDQIIEILNQAKVWDSDYHESMVNAKIGIKKNLMRNLFHTSSIWRTWKNSGTQTVQIRRHYQ